MCCEESTCRNSDHDVCVTVAALLGGRNERKARRFASQYSSNPDVQSQDAERWQKHENSIDVFCFHDHNSMLLIGVRICVQMQQSKA